MYEQTNLPPRKPVEQLTMLCHLPHPLLSPLSKEFRGPSTILLYTQSIN